MWCRIFVSCSVLHSCQPEVKVWTSAQNTRKPSSPRNVSCLLGDPSYVVISLQAVLERLENLLFIINTLYWGLGRDKPLLESTGTDLHTNGFHGEEAADWGAWTLRLQKYFFSTQSENALTRQKKPVVYTEVFWTNRGIHQCWRVKLDPWSSNIYSECWFTRFPAPLKRTIERAEIPGLFWELMVLIFTLK